MNTEKFILSLPEETKLKLLRDCDSVGRFFQISQIFLDAPLDEGGLPTEVIEREFNNAFPEADRTNWEGQ